MTLADAISVVRRGPQKAHPPQNARTAEEPAVRHVTHATQPPFPSPLIFRFTRQKRRMNSCYPVGNEKPWFKPITPIVATARSAPTIHHFLQITPRSRIQEIGPSHTLSWSRMQKIGPSILSERVRSLIQSWTYSPAFKELDSRLDRHRLTKKRRFNTFHSHPRRGL